MRAIRPALLLALLVASNSAQAFSLEQLLEQRIDPDPDYRTIRSQHFAVHYPAALDAVARRVAFVAEALHDKVANAVGWEDDGITHIVVAHRSDEAHVFTFVEPDRQIFFDIALPHMASASTTTVSGMTGSSRTSSRTSLSWKRGADCIVHSHGCLAHGSDHTR